MKIEREIVSRENIKPSAETPPHLTSHKLSLLDQIAAPCYFPLVLYFSASSDHNQHKNADEFISQATRTLKQSLSAALTRYYPLAGRIKDNLSIDCDDRGALFVVSKIKSKLSDFMKKPEKTESRLLIPCELNWISEPAPGAHVLMIQVNYFDCGGIAIGSLFYHRAADGVTISSFIKAWAASAQGVETKFSNYTAGSVFPQNKVMEKESSLFFSMTKYLKTAKPLMRRYVFASSTISTLRTELTAPPAPGGGKGLEFRPSRVEIVSALLWKFFMVASSASGNESLMSHSVNVRRKADPPLPEHTFGNFVWVAPTPSISPKDHDLELKDLVRSVRHAVNKIDGNFVSRMQGEKAFSGYLENVEETLNGTPEKAEYLSFSSWCNFGLYDSIDFGWGKPLWITGCNGEIDTEFPFLNLVWLMDTREGGGIEAWVCIDEKYFAAFENATELKALASFDPSPFE